MMITREEAARLVRANPGAWRISASTGQVSDRMGEVLFTVSGASVDHALLVQAAPELARTVVALYDELARLKRTIACYDAAINELPDRDLVVHIGSRLVDYENDTPQTERPRAPSRQWVPEEERAALALELRRLRAAEAPGTDDDAFAGTGWTSSGTSAWTHESGAYIAVNIMGCWVWSFAPSDADYSTFAIALDAMRAAVPGSV